MNKTIRTPHLTFRPRAIRPVFSEQVPCDDRLAQRVAQPLFEAGIIIAAITERQKYVSGQGVRLYHDLRVTIQGELCVEMNNHRFSLTPGHLLVCPAGTPLRCSAGRTGVRYLYFWIENRPDWEQFLKNGSYTRPYESATLVFLLLRDTLDAMASHQPDAIFVVLSFQIIINVRVGKCRISSEATAQLWATVARHHRNAAPAATAAGNREGAWRPPLPRDNRTDFARPGPS